MEDTTIFFWSVFQNLARRYLNKTFAELASIHAVLSRPRALVICMKVCSVYHSTTWADKMEGNTGIEPASPAWKAGIIAIIRIPHRNGPLILMSRPRITTGFLPVSTYYCGGWWHATIVSWLANPSKSFDPYTLLFSAVSSFQYFYYFPLCCRVVRLLITFL